MGAEHRDEPLLVEVAASTPLRNGKVKGERGRGTGGNPNKIDASETQPLQRSFGPAASPQRAGRKGGGRHEWNACLTKPFASSKESQGSSEHENCATVTNARNGGLLLMAEI